MWSANGGRTGLARALCDRQDLTQSGPHLHALIATHRSLGIACEQVTQVMSNPALCPETFV